MRVAQEVALLAIVVVAIGFCGYGIYQNQKELAGVRKRIDICFEIKQG
jgi:hypothetical protein